MKAKLYRRPDGQTVIIDVKNIDQEDVDFFEAHNIQISLEDIGDAFAIYAENGDEDEDGEPIEVTHVCAYEADCKAEMKTVRKLCTELFGIKTDETVNEETPSQE